MYRRSILPFRPFAPAISPMYPSFPLLSPSPLSRYLFYAQYKGQSKLTSVPQRPPIRTFNKTSSSLISGMGTSLISKSWALLYQTAFMVPVGAPDMLMFCLQVSIR